MQLFIPKRCTLTFLGDIVLCLWLAFKAWGAGRLAFKAWGAGLGKEKERSECSSRKRKQLLNLTDSMRSLHQAVYLFSSFKV